mmetsp:Transcript_61539/g.133184  ORF Transcript_61539/g.133184 Transcript_61539/m.133184 type:complete len:202 (+) Transcript_61539:573-1178(+)
MAAQTLTTKNHLTHFGMSCGAVSGSLKKTPKDGNAQSMSLGSMDSSEEETLGLADLASTFVESASSARANMAESARGGGAPQRKKVATVAATSTACGSSAESARTAPCELPSLRRFAPGAGLPLHPLSPAVPARETPTKRVGKGADHRAANAMTVRTELAISRRLQEPGRPAARRAPAGAAGAMARMLAASEPEGACKSRA